MRCLPVGCLVDGSSLAGFGYCSIRSHYAVQAVSDAVVEDAACEGGADDAQGETGVADALGRTRRLENEDAVAPSFYELSLCCNSNKSYWNFSCI